jgi:dipeptide transport system ATP-binding protein
MPLLEIDNLSVTFQTAGGLFTAVDRFSLNIEPGEIVSIVGESGSGKSVAMLALMGLLPWTATVTADALRFDNQGSRTGSQDLQRTSLLLQPA